MASPDDLISLDPAFSSSGMDNVVQQAVFEGLQNYVPNGGAAVARPAGGELRRLVRRPQSELPPEAGRRVPQGLRRGDCGRCEVLVRAHRRTHQAQPQQPVFERLGGLRPRHDERALRGHGAPEDTICSVARHRCVPVRPRRLTEGGGATRLEVRARSSGHRARTSSRPGRPASNWC